MFLAVAKALRRVTEGKASAQAEAAEWKRKYELERARNLELEQKGFISVFIYYLYALVQHIKFCKLYTQSAYLFSSR